MGARYRTHLTPRVGRGPRVHHVRRKPYSTSPIAFAMTNLHRSGSSTRRRRVMPSLLEIRSLSGRPHTQAKSDYGASSEPTPGFEPGNPSLRVALFPCKLLLYGQLTATQCNCERSELRISGHFSGHGQADGACRRLAPGPVGRLSSSESPWLAVAFG
jgi:hypothetical protein